MAPKVMGRQQPCRRVSNWPVLAAKEYGMVADLLAENMRRYFEANRPLTLWEKLFGRRPYAESCIEDDLMLGLLMVAHGEEL